MGWKEHSLGDKISGKMFEVDDEIELRFGEDYSIIDLFTRAPDQLVWGTILMLGMLFLVPPDAALRFIVDGAKQLISKVNDLRNFREDG